MAQEETGALKLWAPVIGLTLSAFIFNTSEFIPIGLLSDIARDFHITESQAGMIITVYAWIVTVLSLPLMLLAVLSFPVSFISSEENMRESVSSSLMLSSLS